MWKRILSLATLSVFLSGTVYGQTSLWRTLSEKTNVNGTSVSNTQKRVQQTSSTRTPATFCVQQISGLPHLLQLNEMKRAAGLAFKDVVDPIFRQYKDHTPEELNRLVQADPTVFERAFNTPEFDRTFNAFAQQLASFKSESTRVLQASTPPRCYPAITKDLHTLVALLFQQSMEEKLSPLFRTTTRRLAQEYDDHYIIADQVPLAILKGAIDGEHRTTAKKGLQDLALYLAGAGPADLGLIEFALYDTGKEIFQKLEAQGLGEMKPDIMLDMAPIFLLACDVGGVNRGLFSPSCKFLSEQSELWKEGIRRNGDTVRGGEVTVFERGRGKLVSFPNGSTDRQNCTTVDPLALANSFTQGTLNFGDCGLAKTIYACPRTMGNQSFYPNLCHLCRGGGTAGQGPSGMGGTPPARGGGVGDSSSGPLAGVGGPSSQEIRDAFCSQASGDLPGDVQANQIPDSGDCNIPHETQTVCGIDANGNSIEPMAGEPTGEDCRQRAPIAGSGPYSGPSPATGTTLPGRPVFTAPAARDVAAKALDPRALEGQALSKLKLGEKGAMNMAARSANPAVRAAAAGAGGRVGAGVVGRLVGGLIFGAVGLVVQLVFEPVAIASEEYTPEEQRRRDENARRSEERAKQATKNSDEVGKTGVDKDGNKPEDSLKPGATDCTYLGQVLKELNKCRDQQINAGLEAMGRSRIGIVPGSKTSPIGPRWNPDPSQASNGSSAPEFCNLPGAPAAATNSGVCGLMMCGNAFTLTNCCGMNSRDVDLAANCPVCDGVPAIGPDGRCLSECPLEARPTTPPGPNPTPPPTASKAKSTLSTVESPTTETSRPRRVGVPRGGQQEMKSVRTRR